MDLARKYMWLWVIVGMIFATLVISLIFLLINKCISTRGKHRISEIHRKSNISTNSNKYQETNFKADAPPLPSRAQFLAAGAQSYENLAEGSEQEQSMLSRQLSSFNHQQSMNNHQQSIHNHKQDMGEYEQSDYQQDTGDYVQSTPDYEQDTGDYVQSTPDYEQDIPDYVKVEDEEIIMPPPPPPPFNDPAADDASTEDYDDIGGEDGLQSEEDYDDVG